MILIYVSLLFASFSLVSLATFLWEVLVGLRSSSLVGDQLVKRRSIWSKFHHNLVGVEVLVAVLSLL